MNKLFLSFALIIVCGLTIFSQTATPTPPGNDNDVVKISTNLIQLDVSVTDKKGNPVSDLKPEDFEIYENGKKQSVTNLSFMSNKRQVPDEKGDKDKKDSKAEPLLPPPTRVRPEQVHRTIALVVDDLSLSFESTFYVQQALKKFVNEQMQDGDLVAIIRTGAGIGALQQFTTDKRQLLAAIQKVRFNMNGSAKIGVFNPIEATLNEQLNGTKDARGRTRDKSKEIQSERNFDRENSEFRESIFASGTLGALNFIIRGMKDLPGRKSIMLLSDGLALTTRDENGNPQSSRILDSLRRLTDLANRASVVVYTIDARGLVFPGLTAADDVAGLTPDQIEGRLTDRRNELFDTQEGLTYLARQTGGFAMINQNDISRGIRKVLDDQSYYLIGYQPDDETFDPKTRRYNKLEIRVKRDDVKVRYRSGFFGVTDEQIQKPKLSAAQTILNALTSPFAVNDVSLRLNALFSSDEKGAPFIRSVLNVNAKDLTFTQEPDGMHKSTFDVIALTFGDNGAAVDEISKTITMTLKPEEYKRAMDRGVIFNFTLPVKKRGAYQMRVAIRDSASNKVGSSNQFIEVPNIKKNRLTLSGVILASVPLEKMQQISTLSPEDLESLADPLLNTSVRQFKPGTALIYSYEIYNARLDASKKREVTSVVALFRDGKVVFNSKPAPLDRLTQESPQRAATDSVIRFGRNMEPGDYVMEITVTDSLAKEKYKSATQFVQFEIVE